MSKGTYSHSNRHRMHELKQKGDDFCCKNSTKKDEPQVTNYDEVANLKRIIKDYADDLKHWKNMWANQRDDIKLLGDEIVKLRRENEELKRTLSKSMYALQENEELLKDKERLNALLKATRHLADGFRLDNRELKRMLDKAFDAGFELEYDEASGREPWCQENQAPLI